MPLSAMERKERERERVGRGVTACYGGGAPQQGREWREGERGLRVGESMVPSAGGGVGRGMHKRTLTLDFI
jgi:hypothetical protein